ncbi:MAG: YafY family transcriptional regulator [Oscillospiraceae bacterium]|nr:YafY family transcriptional regulator [Oscillospiraceae bacterium]
MQIERLFGIVYILLDRKNITAKELAARFEVSVRTIYRDVDTLSQSGIPIYTNKGRGGGISLVENYVLNKSLITEREQREILYALQGMNSVASSETAGVLSKLSGLFRTQAATDWIEIDFSGWSKQQGDDFILIKTAVLNKQTIGFDYFGANGEKSMRIVEPQRLWFKHRAWYLKGYCRLREDMRLFRITRMKNLTLLNEHFTGEMPEIKPVREIAVNKAAALVMLRLRIDASQAYRVYDEFDEDVIERDGDGHFIVSICYSEDEWVYGFLLSFGPYIDVLGPDHVRRGLYERTMQMLARHAPRGPDPDA